MKGYEYLLIAALVGFISTVISFLFRRSIKKGDQREVEDNKRIASDLKEIKESQKEIVALLSRKVSKEDFDEHTTWDRETHLQIYNKITKLVTVVSRMVGKLDLDINLDFD